MSASQIVPSWAWLGRLSLGLLLSAAGWPLIATAQSDSPRVQYRVAHVSPAAGGVYAYAAERWGILHLELGNPHDQPIDVLCATYFQDEDTLQYGRRMWLPAKSRLRAWHPVRLPALKPGQTQIDYRTLVMEADGASETLIRDSMGKMQLDGTLRMFDQGPVTGLVESLDADEAEASEVTPFDVVITARVEHVLPRKIAHLRDPLLPASEEGLDALDHLVLANDRLLADQAGMAAVRHWLYGGGRLWVMLDQTGPEVLEALLGDEFACQVVDQVSLTSVKLVPAAGPENGEFTYQAEYERPVDLVRAIVSGAEVAYLVNGWPAAFWLTCGEGRLLVTTLGPAGWVRPRTASDPPQRVVDGQSEFVASRPLSELTYSFLLSRRPNPLPPIAELAPLAREHVGYSIPPRWLVVSALGGFCLALAGVGGSLWRTGRFERLALYGPLIALAASAALVAVGQQRRQAIPPAVAMFQVIEPIPGTNDVRSSGVASLYSPDTGAQAIAGAQGGWLAPDMSGMELTTRRLVWTDIAQWRWENLPQTPGLRDAVFHQSHALKQRVEAQATAGPRGMAGQAALPEGLRPEDAVLATRRGRIGVEFQRDGSFTAKADDVLGPDQFLSAALMSDEQSRRSRAMASLLASAVEESDSQRPMLYFWTQPWPFGFDFGDSARRVGAALVAVPVSLTPPAGGSEVVLPSPLLPYREITGPDGIHPSGLYDYRRDEWQKKASPTSNWLRFQVPQALLPLAPTRARVVVKMTGPMGKLEIGGWKAGGVATARSWTDPVGTLSTEISDAELLQLDPQGGLVLRIAGGDAERPELTRPDTSPGGHASYWQIESLTLELWASVPETAP